MDEFQNLRCDSTPVKFKIYSQPLHAPDVHRRPVLLVVQDLGRGVRRGSTLCGQRGLPVKHVTQAEIWQRNKAVINQKQGQFNFHRYTCTRKRCSGRTARQTRLC